MDLGAYAQIEDLEAVASRNGIDCPRLRGYRLMADEEPVDIDKYIKEKRNDFEVEALEDLIRASWDYSFSISTYSRETDRSIKYYISGKKWTDDERYVRWDRLHGKRRKMLKTVIHNTIVRYKKQFEVWNKYAGRNDILYIHARIGGGNWPYYYKDVVDKPWFIEKVDDWWDGTYCDIYARIKEE